MAHHLRVTVFDSKTPGMVTISEGWAGGSTDDGFWPESKDYTPADAEAKLSDVKRSGYRHRIEDYRKPVGIVEQVSRVVVAYRHKTGKHYTGHDNEIVCAACKVNGDRDIVLRSKNGERVKYGIIQCAVCGQKIRVS